MANKIVKMTCYPMDRDKIGLAIIINNLDTEQPQTRNDVKNLEETFSKIGVEVKKPKLNQDKKELEVLADELATDDFYTYNAVFLVLISHGRTGDLIVCQDRQTNFNSNIFVEKLCQNTSLIGQPKILLSDFCRGDEFNEGETKSTSLRRIPHGSDVFIGHATTSGYVSITGSNSSPFIDALCDQMQQLYESTHFLAIFQRVQQKVSEISNQISKKDGANISVMQIPELKSTLRMDLFFLKKGRMYFKFMF